MLDKDVDNGCKTDRDPSNKIDQMLDKHIQQKRAMNSQTLINTGFSSHLVS